MNYYKKTIYIFLFIFSILIFKISILYSEEANDVITKEIISEIEEHNQKIWSYKVEYSIKIKEEQSISGHIFRRGILLFDRNLGKIKHTFVNMNTNSKYISLCDNNKKECFTYKTKNKICRIISIKELEKALQQSLDVFSFILNIKTPFSNLNMENIKYISVENIGLTWAYHFRYKNNDLWIGTEDGLLYKKKRVRNNKEEIIFSIDRIEKNINIKSEEFTIELPDNIKKIDDTQRMIEFFKKRQEK